MQSALIVHSKHTNDYAKWMSKKYKNVIFLEVAKPPRKEILRVKNDKDVVIGIGGGSVIDTAKIISKDKRCIAIPTTAAGASTTPYATVWGEEKISIPTKIPILKMDSDMSKNLSFRVRQSTTFDALSHAIESFWSKRSTTESREYSKKAIEIIKKHILTNKNVSNKDVNKLINAGNLAGKAIAIAKTNVVHAASYPITIEYGINHGTACGMLLPYFVEHMNFGGLSELFNLDSTEKLVSLLKKSFILPEIKNFNVEMSADKIMKYDKINDGPKKIDKKSLVKILKDISRV